MGAAWATDRTVIPLVFQIYLLIQLDGYIMLEKVYS